MFGHLPGLSVSRTSDQHGCCFRQIGPYAVIRQLRAHRQATPKEQSAVRCWNQLETQTFSMPAQSEFGTL